MEEKTSSMESSDCDEVSKKEGVGGGEGHLEEKNSDREEIIAIGCAKESNLETNEVVGEEKALNRLCRPHMRHSLFKVLEKMLPKDYVSFMLTNKEMFKACTSVKKMPLMINCEDVHGNKESWDHERNVAIDDGDLHVHLEECKDCPLFGKEKEWLQLLPHPISVSRFSWEDGDMGIADFEAILRYLETNRVKKIEKMVVEGWPTCWDQLLEMAKVFGVKSLHINGFDGNDLSAENLKAIFCSDFLMTFSSYDSFSNHNIISCILPSLHLWGTTLNRDSCVAVIRRWLDGFTINEWMFEKGPDENELLPMLVMNLRLSVLRYKFSSRLTDDERPLAFAHPSGKLFWILREDGQILCVGCLLEFIMCTYSLDWVKKYRCRLLPPTALLSLK